MSVSVLDRPYGYNLIAQTAGLSVSDIGGAAIFKTASAHGLSTGDHVYIKSTIVDYNGFWYVEVVDTDEFYVKLNVGASGVGYFQNIIFDWYKTTSHNWNCVHLPIVYRLLNTKWPINSSDTTRAILSHRTDNGYTNFRLSGSLGTFSAMEFVKISGASPSTLDGVYQIVDKFNTSDISIDLAYTATDNFSAATCQIYYNNYYVSVKVYGGLASTHAYYAQKPEELLATLELIPDSSGVCMFSIADILKAHIEQRNELLLGTLPNNLDFWTGFYITYAESYDASTVYGVLGNTPGSYTDDGSTFKGFAVNAVLPFKNVYSGAFSEYVSGDSNQKFLTAFDEPNIFAGKYFDLSFIIPKDYYPYEIRRQKYLSSVLQSTAYDAVSQVDNGIYRQQIEIESTEDRIDASLVVRNTGFTDSAINFTPGAVTESYNVYIPSGQTAPGTYQYTVEIISGVSGTDSATILIQYVHSDGTFTTIATATRTTVGTTTVLSTALPTPTKDVVQIKVTCTIVDGAPAGLDAAVNGGVTITDSVFVLSEVKTITVNSECSNQDRYLTWLNPYGGFDYWNFTGKKDRNVLIESTGQSAKNIFPDWPKSHGEFADTKLFQTFRKSRNQELVRSQNLTQAQVDAISGIKSSPLVQIVESIYDRRTVIVDDQSFTIRKEIDKNFTIQFVITYTDELPSQTG